MATFKSPPPAATFLAFHPQDSNIIAIGMDDSSIQIYNVKVDEVKAELKAHQKRITGLAFSNILNVLISSGSNSQFKKLAKHCIVKNFLPLTHLCLTGCVFGALIRGRRKQVNTCKAHLVARLHLLQILMYNFTRIKHIY
ncbi:unnamed protein product [Fraxinus pennsylvanica]|uniref:Uncharacterized protein n=1 Tax=Fraxinus pennsylvanica TaxID=56036 RepID=A0AAD2E876_9LAMI|nr:unnamed protein product [Fraxinus pennsylvanica]